MPVAVSDPMLWLPCVAFVPDHAPEAVQLVALAEVQLSVDAPPEATEVGDALIETVGAGVAVTMVTLADFEADVPPAFVQVSV